ncbi:CUE domain [Nakaseomyces glabratus]|nr:hypothetical protein LTX96_0002268 [Nakaseomyces glabratus]
MESSQIREPKGQASDRDRNSNKTSQASEDLQSNFKPELNEQLESHNQVVNALQSPEHEEEDVNETYYNFQLFLDQIQDTRCAPLIKYTRSFLRNFVTQRAIWSATEQDKLIKDFKTFIYSKYKDFKPFSDLNKTELRNAEEGMEKLLTGKLYHHLFSPLLAERAKAAGIEADKEHLDDIEKDKMFIKKVAEFKFIEPTNLDISFQNVKRVKKFTSFASIELNKMNNFKAPRDKMVCILNASKILFGLMKHSEETGADCFVPLLIYTLLSGKIENLVSNINFIERFRYSSLFRGEEAYYLSSLQAASNFILKLDKKSLTIENEKDFDTKYEQNIENVKQDQLQKEKLLKETKQEESSNMLDDVSNMVMNKLNEFFIQDEPQKEKKKEVHHKANSKNEDGEVASMIKQLEAKEHQETVETLTSMFPDLDVEIIEDVCIAKKHRIGPCVDVLLTLSN